MPTDDPLLAKLDPDEVARDANVLAPALRDVARRQIFKTVAISTGLLGAAMFVFHLGSWPLGLFALTLIVVAVMNIAKETRRRQMGVTLPSVLRSLDLQQTPGGPGFLRSLPARLFPRVAEPVLSNVFAGALDGFPVTIAEVKVTDRTDDSGRAIFEGLVLCVGLPVSLPDFVILDETLSRKMEMTSAPAVFARKPYIDVGFLQRNQDFNRGVHGLRLWSSGSADIRSQPLASVLRVLCDPPTETGIAGRIHSATNGDNAVFIALRPKDAPGRIDWTSASGPNASLVIHVTFEWLAQPMALAKALIAATGHATNS